MTSLEESQYGHFCDIETAIITEYDKVEYYVKTTSTRYEVRRKMIIKPDINSISEESITPESDEENQTCCKPTEHDDHPKRGCIYSIIRLLGRFPRDIVYSLLVCIITVSSVILVMTYDPNV